MCHPVCLHRPRDQVIGLPVFRHCLQYQARTLQAFHHYRKCQVKNLVGNPLCRFNRAVLQQMNQVHQRSRAFCLQSSPQHQFNQVWSPQMSHRRPPVMNHLVILLCLWPHPISHQSNQLVHLIQVIHHQCSHLYFQVNNHQDYQQYLQVKGLPLVQQMLHRRAQAIIHQDCRPSYQLLSHRYHLL